jgi:DNA helicase-2/ATP-dependent DNA helicase PcrA
MDYRKELETNNHKIIEYRKLIIQLEQENKCIGKKIIDNVGGDSEILLNEEQRRAIEESDNNSIIIACPGSGKTHTLIEKVNYLVKEKNVNPDRIIMITFTKKASQEMNERLRKKIGFKKLLHVGTIHGLAYRTLQKYDKINYTILDEKDCRKGMLESFNNVNGISNVDKKKKSDSTTTKPNGWTKELESLIYKKCIVTYDIMTSKYPIDVKDVVTFLKMDKYYDVIKKVMIEYKRYKVNNMYLDFNDLMIRYLDFLKSDNSKDFLSLYDYILFDEYQDVNSIQNLILKEMNKRCQNLTVVGDDAQAIYSFRGSEVKYIINFDKNYGEHGPVNKFLLEKNYRSTPEIIKFCNDIIKKNNNQLDKKMEPTKFKSMIQPKIAGFPSIQSEVQYIVSKIRYNRELGMKLKDHVVITRTNRQLDNFELELIKNKISYIKSKGIGLLDRVHVKDFISFLVILVNPRSTIHWKRVVKLVPGIGNVSMNKIFNSKNILESILNPVYKLGSSIGKKLNTLNKLMKALLELYKDSMDKQQDNCTNDNDNDNIISKKDCRYKICEKIIKYLKPLIKNNMRMKEQMTFNEKIDDMDTLKSYIMDATSIHDFLTDIHLNIQINEGAMFDNVADIDEDLDDYLLLSTIHGSKGLEWDNVFMAGCSSDILPSFKPTIYTQEMDNIEEERRLFYVGCSRTRKRLEVTLSYDYHFCGYQIFTSPFIGDIDTKLYEGTNLCYPETINKGDVTRIVSNYLILNSISKIYPLLKTLEYKYDSYYHPYVDTLIYKNKCEMIYGSFVDNLMAKMVYQNHGKDMENLSVPVYDRFNLRKDKAYHEYIDPNNDWCDSINAVLAVSIRKCRCPMGIHDLKKIVLSEGHMKNYKNIEKMLNTVVDKCLKKCNRKKKLPDKMVNVHYNISYGDVMGEADIVVGRTLIEIKTSKECIATTKYVLQCIMYRYLLRKKGIRIDEIILMNPMLGETYTLKVTPTWKNTFRVYQELVKN